MKRLLSILIAVLLLAAPITAEIGGSNSVSVTSVVTNVTFTGAMVSVCIINVSVSANELYARLFQMQDTIAAATTSSPIRLEPGESQCFNYNPIEPPSAQYKGLSLICAAAETATARYTVK